jgi:hypothetical protein
MFFIYLDPKPGSLFWGEITCLKHAISPKTSGFGAFLFFGRERSAAQMKVRIDCRTCGAQIIFDIYGVSDLTVMDIQNAIDIFEEELAGFSREEIEWAYEQINKGKEDRKMLMFSEKCPKCGMPHTLKIYGVLLA